MFTRMSGLHRQEQFFRANGKAKTAKIHMRWQSRPTVGHIPCTIFCLCSMFARRSGSIICMITGARKRSTNLPQGGLELPCTYTFNGPEDTVKKVKQRLIEEGPGKLY